MIKFDKVSFAYENQKVIDGLSLDFNDNEITSILGPSGSGKTTMLNLIMGSITPQSGVIQGSSDQVSVLFQEDRLVEELNVYQNLELVLLSIINDKIVINNTIDKYLKIVGLHDYKFAYLHQLSGSMRRRLSLARAFIYPSKLLLMDEPFQGLDIQIRQEMIRLFLTLWEEQKRTVIFVTHDIDEALLLSDNVYVMTNKPTSLQKRFDLNEIDKSTRKTYSDVLSPFRTNIYKEIEKWYPSKN